MKRLLPPLLALPLLLGACSNMNSDGARFPVPPAPVRIADRSTNWGPQPSYDGKGQYFYHMSRLSSHEYMLNGVAVLDLLVNRDGTVQKMAVVSSSGDISTDQMATGMYAHARYSLPLGPDDPAPYVVRETVVFKKGGVLVNGSAYGPSDYSSTDYYPTSSPQYSDPGNSNTVNGFVR